MMETMMGFLGPRISLLRFGRNPSAGVLLAGCFLFASGAAFYVPLPVESEWFFENMEAGGDHGAWTSVASDSMNAPHVIYSDTLRGALTYAHREEGKWETMIVDNSGVAGSWNDLELGSDNHPRAVYESTDPHELRFAQLDSGKWMIESVHTGAIYRDASLELSERTNEAHIAFRTEDSGVLYYGQKLEGNWRLEVVGEGYYGCSLALDPNGVPHVSYFDSVMSTIVHAYRVGDSWIKNVVSRASSEWQTRTSIDVSPAGSVHIVFADSGELRYHGSIRGVPTTETIDSGVDPDLRQVSISFDPVRNIAHVIYLKGGTLTYAHSVAEGWRIEKLVEASATVAFCLDGDYTPHVAFYRRDKVPGPPAVGELWYGSRMVKPESLQSTHTL
ncbi:MAG: hypothetical protein KAW09_01240 [Thermoplasmata archaeon]|nr:hypothetical protein [Thermoplasmata archaeon]